MKNRRLNRYILAAMLPVAVWFACADLVFRLRHPWATETQRFLHFFDALTFQKVDCPYGQRPASEVK